MPRIRALKRDKSMKIKKGFVVRMVGGKHIAVPVGKMSKDFHGMINLNDTGALLWNFFTSDHTVDEGVAALLAEFDVSEEIARADVERFVSTLSEIGCIE